MEATVGVLFLVDVAAAEEEEAPGFSLENRAEMNWVEVGWKEEQCLISSSNCYLLNYWKLESPLPLIRYSYEIRSQPPPVSPVL